jgi:asparagine synthase (glutamine-hydrolysing)
MDWHRVGDDGGDSGEHDVRRFFLESGLPSRAPQNIAWFFPIYRFMAERGSRITIGGEQGNTYFSASGLEFLPSLLQGLHWQTLAGEIRALARVEGTSIWSVVKSRVLRPYEPLSWRLRRQSEAPEPWGRHSALNPSFAAELDLERTLDISRYRLRIGGGHPSAQTFRAWLWHDENARDTRSGLRAMTGTEHRLPMADRRLVEFIGALPRDQFLRKGVTRFLARRLLAGRLPDAIVNGRARGVQNGDWFAIVSAQRPAMQAELSRLRGQKLASRVVDLDRLQSLLDGWPRDASEAEPQRAKYLQMLTRGMEMARFLAWHEGGNG